MVRMVIDVDDCGDTLATKEATAMALEPLGNVRIAQVTEFHGGKEKVWRPNREGGIKP